MVPYRVTRLIAACLLAMIGGMLTARAGQSRPIDEPLPIDRQALVHRHDPVVHAIDPSTPFSVGNGRFTFTADVTGLQSLPVLYFRDGIPLETKARWAWHRRSSPRPYSLDDVMARYDVGGREVVFPTRLDTPAANWLRQNPHDLPLARIGFVLAGEPISATSIRDVDQHLDLWRGLLESRYSLDGVPVAVTTVVADDADRVAARITSDLLAARRLAVQLSFPRGYDTAVKNTPALVFGPPEEHSSDVVSQEKHAVVIRREVDDHVHFVRLSWTGDAVLEQTAANTFVLQPAGSAGRIDVAVEFSPSPPAGNTELHFDGLLATAAAAFDRFWRSGGAIDLAGSSDPRAAELERRIVLSRYLMAVQSRAAIPSQETGLTSSSWYGKLHTEMSWWHSAHWALWGQPEHIGRLLDWYVEHLDSARALAVQRGLEGARWAKMVGPDNRESPGGNALIIWNQPQPIHLAELLYRSNENPALLRRYAELVNATASALASMLTWDAARDRYSLEPPIWIAQEIYEPRESRNPAFELAYWRYGLQTAQKWRQRLGEQAHPDWQAKLDRLAPLPSKDHRYVAMESIPDTFDNAASRRDHPTMLAPLGLLGDPTVDREIMAATLDAVLAGWDFEGKIWGWDYPMIAMTAARLGRPDTAIDILLADAPHNRYLPNGHCPQPGASLPAYLPANGALLAAVAMMAAGWDGAPTRSAPGFPDDGRWKVRSEGLAALD